MISKGRKQRTPLQAQWRIPSWTEHKHDHLQALKTPWTGHPSTSSPGSGQAEVCGVTWSPWSLQPAAKKWPCFSRSLLLGTWRNHLRDRISLLRAERPPCTPILCVTNRENKDQGVKNYQEENFDSASGRTSLHNPRQLKGTASGDSEATSCPGQHSGGRSTDRSPRRWLSGDKSKVLRSAPPAPKAKWRGWAFEAPQQVSYPAIWNLLIQSIVPKAQEGHDGPHVQEEALSFCTEGRRRMMSHLPGLVSASPQSQSARVSAAALLH